MLHCPSFSAFHCGSGTLTEPGSSCPWPEDWESSPLVAFSSHREETYHWCTCRISQLLSWYLCRAGCQGRGSPSLVPPALRAWLGRVSPTRTWLLSAHLSVSANSPLYLTPPRLAVYCGVEHARSGVQHTQAWILGLPLTSKLFQSLSFTFLTWKIGVLSGWWSDYDNIHTYLCTKVSKHINPCAHLRIMDFKRLRVLGVLCCFLLLCKLFFLDRLQSLLGHLSFDELELRPSSSMYMVVVGLTLDPDSFRLSPVPQAGWAVAEYSRHTKWSTNGPVFQVRVLQGIFAGASLGIFTCLWNYRL